MDRADERVLLDIVVRMDDGSREVLWSSVATYSDLVYVEEELEQALAAVRRAMGKA